MLRTRLCGHEPFALLLITALAGCPAADDPCSEVDGPSLAVGTLCARVSQVAVLRDGDQLEPLDPKSALRVDVGAIGTEAAKDGGTVLHLEAPGAARALVLVLEGLPFDAALQNGWQSWSFAGELELPRSVATAADGLPAFFEARSGDPVDVDYGISDSSVALASTRAPGAQLVAGALTSHRAATGFATVVGDDGKARMSIVYGVNRETLPLNDGATHSEPIWLQDTTDAGLGLVALGEAMAAAAGAAGGEERPHAPQRPPGGWYSWNEHFDDIDQELIRAHIDTARTHLLPAGLPLIEIDDGWSKAWGDWQANERFPDGMDAMAAEVLSAGLVPGIWTAPFLIEIDSSAATTLPEEAFVHTTTGERLEHSIFGNPRRLLVIDATSTAGLAHLSAMYAPLVDAGFSFFKLDFLYAAALPGVRAAPVTGVMALRDGMRHIRSLIGETAVINGCGGPVAPLLGLVDSLRVGVDITFGNPSFSFVAFAARDLAARRFVFPLAWPDADQFLLREPLTLEEGRTGAALVALAGPAYSFGDDLVALPLERRTIGLDPIWSDIATGDAPAVPVLFASGSVGVEVYGNPTLEALANSDAPSPPPQQWRATARAGDELMVRFDWNAHTVEVAPR